MHGIIVVLLVAVVAGATFGAHSQTLEFDGVCAAPPCAAGVLYAAAGATISPTSFPVVAAGTNGLTGTNGGRYLSLNAFPYQATISLARTATFVAVDVARSDLGTAGQTVTLQALNNGAPVGSPQTITLGNVNQWSTVSLSHPGGFNGVFLDAAAGGVNKTFGADNVRISGNCAGFADVSPTASFCNATEWLYNRGVTLGCALGEFCPSGNVTRAQMALFMQRLGTALSPVTLFNYDQFFGDFFFLGHRRVICTIPFTPTQPASATAIATMITDVSPNAGTYALYIAYSTNEGASFAPFPGSGWTTAFVRVPAGGSASQTLATPALPLQVGKKYLFVGQVARETGGAGNVTHHCHLQVTITNGSPTTAPFDAAEQSPQTIR